jgi:hypothetical protein
MVATAINAGPGNGTRAKRPNAQAATGSVTRPTTLTSLKAIP